MSIFSHDDTDSTKESDGDYDTEHYSNLDMRMEDDVDALDGIDLDCDGDMERDSGNVEGKDEAEEDEVEEDEKEDEDDGRESWTISQGKRVNTSADNVDTMVDDQPIVLPEQSQEMPKHTPWPQPPAPSIQPINPQPHPLPPMLESHSLSRL
jgi:hypothetical protein